MKKLTLGCYCMHLTQRSMDTMVSYREQCLQSGLIRTVDTDVVVLAVSLAQELQSEDKLWLAFGTS